jgi:signal transduction histidine kinase
LLITVEDTGIGIDPENLNRIFDPFFTTKPHGMGMGLSICRSIIQNHDGRLSLSAGQPYGSIFYVFCRSARRSEITKKLSDARNLPQSR